LEEARVLKAGRVGAPLALVDGEEVVVLSWEEVV
jgi:hypothetical protein